MLEDQNLVGQIKELFAPDGGAEREHNAALGSLGFGLIHYALVRNLKPDNALVIGSRTGYIPVIIALALLDNGRGRLDFVDANYDDAQCTVSMSRLVVSAIGLTGRAIDSLFAV